MTEYIVEMYNECEKYSSEYGCKPTNTHGFPLREEIVRCEDCKYWRRFYPESEQRFGTCRAWRYTTRFDGYCHNASKVEKERKSE